MKHDYTYDINAEHITSEIAVIVHSGAAAQCHLSFDDVEYLYKRMKKARENEKATAKLSKP